MLSIESYIGQKMSVWAFSSARSYWTGRDGSRFLSQA